MGGEWGKYENFNCTQVLYDPSDIADREMSRLLEGFQKLNDGGLPRVSVTERSAPNDPRKDESIFDIPKASEMEGLFYNGTFEVA